ncbi:MAG: GDP-mannose mannosyl hydrolase [Aliarcobacter sp.]|nr:GDP-mannose mannosyl hydrolase [Aliarcobacter sp.]
MLDLNTFKTVVDNTPLISIDFIVKNSDNKILLGKRVNEPAKNHLFTLGGRVYKNEKLNDAKKRILKDELGLNIDEYTSNFIGVFEHFYQNSFVDDNISTHYVNLAYEIHVSYIQDLPKAQHNSYIWLSLDELINSNEVHKYVKDYFKNLNLIAGEDK